MKTKRSILSFTVVFGLLIFLHFFHLLQPFENIIRLSLSPLLNKTYSLSTSIRNIYNFQNDHRDLLKTNQEQQNSIAMLTVENARLRSLEEENQALRRYLKFQAKTEYKYVLGNVISRGDITGSGQSIIIDKGTKDGLRSGLLVVDSFGAVIGKIFDVKDNISEIYLTTNPKNKMAVAIQNESKTSGIIQGELGLVIKMNFVPQTEKIKKDDLVVTSGLEQSIPRGFAVGKIIKVEKENNELWQFASIEPLVDLDKLVTVSVLLPSVK